MHTLAKKNSIDSLQKYVFEVVEQYSLTNSSWKTIIIDISMPYAEGKIEGGTFSFQWISHMLHVDIQIWSSQTQNFVEILHCSYKPLKYLLFLMED